MNNTTTVFVLAALASCVVFGRSKSDPAEPDYTKGERMKNPGQNYAALGPTGAHGWIWAQRGGDPTAETRMILIKAIDKGTPADGLLQVGDVILGINATRFSSDARKALSAAITEAEKNESKGKLVLNVWRPTKGSDGKQGPSTGLRTGRTMQVTLTLPVMGSYSRMSPRKCEKTEKIIKAACDAIVKRGISKASYHTVGQCVDALGLLATGDKQYWPVVRTYIRGLEPQMDKALEEDRRKPGMICWGVAYANLLLAEYYLLTKDESVLPFLRKMTDRIVKGASEVGTWGHGFAIGASPHRRLGGYGCISQTSLTCAISLVLAKKAGATHKHLDSVIQKSAGFYSFYVDKGGLPYGDHAPITGSHVNNGVNSQAAIFFDLLGNKQACNFFTRLTLSSGHIREGGHSGHFFNRHWGPLGAVRGGDEAVTAFARDTRWFNELERRPNGLSIYQPQLANVDHRKHINWSTTGSRLMQYCLGRKVLYLTGKGRSTIDPILGAELEEILQVRNIKPGDTHSVDELLSMLGSPWPRIRYQAAWELNKREEDVVDKLVTMLESKNRYARYGACTGLKYAGRGSKKALQALTQRGLYSEDTNMRYHATEALAVNPKWQDPNPYWNKGIKYERTLARISHLALPDLIKIGVRDYPEEARLHTLYAVSFVVFGNCSLRDRGPHGRGLISRNQAAWKAIDTNTRTTFLRKVLTSDYGNARTAVGSSYSQFSEETLALLMPEIHAATEHHAVSGIMFGWGVRNGGARIMAKYGIQEGMPAGMTFALGQPQHLEALVAYGQALIDHFPTIEAGIARRSSRDPKTRRFKAAFNKIKATPAPKLITIKEFQKGKVGKE